MSYKVNWKKLSFKEKAEYIWEYYWIPMVLIAALAVFLASVVLKSYTEEKPVLNILVINSGLTEVPDGYAFEEFLEENGYTISESTVNCNISLNFAQGKDERDHEIINMENYQLLSTWILSGDYDVLIGTGAPFYHIADQGAMQDLTQILPDLFLNEYEDQLFDANVEGVAQSYPCAVSMEKYWNGEDDTTEERIFIGILKSGENQEAALNFLNYILNHREKGV